MKARREQREVPQHFWQDREESVKGSYAVHTSPLTIWEFYSFYMSDFPPSETLQRVPINSHFPTICHLAKHLCDFKGDRSHMNLHICFKFKRFIFPHFHLLSCFPFPTMPGTWVCHSTRHSTRTRHSLYLGEYHHSCCENHETPAVCTYQNTPAVHL